MPTYSHRVVSTYWHSSRSEHLLAQSSEHLLAQSSEHLLAQSSENLLAQSSEHLLAQRGEDLLAQSLLLSEPPQNAGDIIEVEASLPPALLHRLHQDTGAVPRCHGEGVCAGRGQYPQGEEG